MQYGKYQFICFFETQAELPPYKGSTFRGVFGIALKKVICALKTQECAACLLLKQCLYPSIFETPQVCKPPLGANFASVPHPFVIEPPETESTQFAPQAPFNFNLLLFGEINSNLPYFIYAFDQMGKIGVGRRINGRRGRFRLQVVRFDNRAIYSADDGILKSPEPLPQLSLGDNESGRGKIANLTIHLKTPLRFKHRNHLSDKLPFHLLVRTMLRRVDALFTIYGHGKPNLDFRGLIERAGAVKIASSDLRWSDWRRYSQRQSRAMQMGGLAGSVTYTGDLAEFMPLINCCETLHIGKQTTFGLGKIRLESGVSD